MTSFKRAADTNSTVDVDAETSALTAGLSAARTAVQNFKSTVGGNSTVDVDIETGGLTTGLSAARSAVQNWKSMAEASSTVTLEADTTGLRSGLSAADSSLGGLGATMGGTALLARSLGGAAGLLGVGLGAGAVANSAVGLNARLEQSDIAFTTMLGSGQKSKAFLDELAAFAAKTPFEFPELVTSSQKLLAMGFTAQEVRPMLTSIGNASAALGAGSEGISRMTMALGQMQAKGKVSSEEMMQMTEMGVPAWDMLAKKMGVDVPTAMDKVSAGAVKASTFMEAFQSGVAGRYGDMMAKQSQTAAGAWSTIVDSIQMGTATAFKPMFNVIRGGTVAVAGFLSGASFEAWSTRTAASLQGVINKATQFGSKVKTALQAAFIPAGSGPGGQAGGSGPLAGFANSLKVAWAGIQGVFGQIKAGVMGLARTLGPQLMPAFRNFKAGLMALKPAGSVLAAFLGGVLKGAFQTLIPVVGTVLVVGLRAAALAFRGIATAVGWVAQKLQPFLPQVRLVGQIVGMVFSTVIVGAVGAALRTLGAFIRFVPILGRVVGPVLSGLGRAFQAAATIGGLAFRALSAVIGRVVGFIGARVGFARNVVTTAWNWISQKTAGLRSSVSTATTSMMNWVTSRWTSGTDRVRSIASSAWNWVTTRTGQLGDDIGNIWNRLRDSVSTRARELKDRVINRVHELGSELKASFTRQWNNATDLYGRLRDGVGRLLNEAKDRGINAIHNLGSELKASFGRQLEGARAFGDKFRGIINDKFQWAINTARGWLGSLMYGVGNVLELIGADGLAGDAKAAGDRLKAPAQLARGGVVTASDGAVGTGKRIIAITNEDGPEAVVPLSRKTPEGLHALRTAASAHNYELQPKNRGPRGHRRRESGGPAVGNRRLARQNAAAGPGMRQQAGWFGGFGPATYTLVKPLKEIADKVTAKFGTPWNSYVNHPPGATNQPYWRERSVDWWGSGGRGDPIGGVWTGVADMAANLLGSNMEYMLTPSNDPAGHWDHVHVSAFIGSPGLETATGEGGGGFDWMGKITSIMDDIKPFPDMKLGIIGRAMPEFAKTLLSKAKDWLIDQAKEKFGGLFGAGPYKGGGNLDEWAKNGLNYGQAVEATPTNISKIKTLAMKESTGNPNARNPAAVGGEHASGLMQMLPSTFNAHKVLPGDDIFNPVHNVASSSRYQVSRYGGLTTMSPYERGGMIPGVRGQAKALLAHAGEMVIPAGMSRAFYEFATSLQRFNQFGPNATSTGAVGGAGAFGTYLQNRTATRMTTSNGSVVRTGPDGVRMNAEQTVRLRQIQRATSESAAARVDAQETNRLIHQLIQTVQQAAYEPTPNVIANLDEMANHLGPAFLNLLLSDAAKKIQDDGMARSLRFARQLIQGGNR